MAPPRRASDDKLERLQSLADTIASLTTSEERPPDPDDAIATVDSLIAWARTLSKSAPGQIAVIREKPPAEWCGLRIVVDPGLPPTLGFVVGPKGDAYPFTVPSYPNMVACPNCKGDGEVIDFPTETDERMVCCPTCGGQGEVPAS